MNSPELMPAQLEHLRARIAEVLKQGPNKRRYGNDLKRAIVDYAFARQDEHATIGQIAAEFDLSVWLLGKWLRHARLRLEKGKIPGEPLPMPWLDAYRAAAKPSAAGSPPSVPSASRGPSSSRGVRRRQAATPRPIVIPATTLAEFLAGAVARYGGLRRAADGIAVPYSTLRGWLRGRYADAGDRGPRSSMP